MKLKAKTTWNKKDVLIKPVFFRWGMGIQYKNLSSCSIFCSKGSDFIFPLKTKIIIAFLKIWYWIKMYLWKQIRYWIPAKIIRILKPIQKDDLPF